jgi:hypothetical protein
MADLTVTAARIAPVNETQYVAKTFIANGAITAGQAVYLNTSGKVATARANATGTINGLVGVALNGGAAGDAIEVMIRGSVYGFTLSGMNTGTKAYVSSATAGALADTAVTGTGNFAVPIGTVVPMSDPSLTKVLWVDVNLAAVYTALP